MTTPSLSGSAISSTYNRLVQTDGAVFADGTGSIIELINITSSTAITASYAHYAVSASHEIIKEESSSFADTASYVNPLVQDVDITGSLNIQTGGGYLSLKALGGGSTQIEGSSTLGLNSIGALDFYRNGVLHTRIANYTSNWLIGTTIDSGAKLHVKGSGTTSATTALLVQNANASASLQVRDDGAVKVGGGDFGHPTITRFQVNNGSSNVLRVDTSTMYLGSIDTITRNTSAGSLTLQTTNGNTANKLILGDSDQTYPDYNFDATTVLINQNYIHGTGSQNRNRRHYSLRVAPYVYFDPLTVRKYTGLYINPSGSVENAGDNDHYLLDASFNDNKKLVVKYNGTVGINNPNPSYSLDVSGSGNFTDGLTVTGSTQIYKSGSIVLDIQGSSGQLFSVTDSLTGSLFSVNTVAGLPVMEAFSDNTVNIGKFGVYPIKVINSGSSAVITGSLFGTASFASTASYTTAISGTTNFIPKFTPSGSTLGDSQISDNGSQIKIGNFNLGVASTTTNLIITGSTRFSAERNAFIEILTNNSNFPTINGYGNGVTITTSNSYGTNNGKILLQPQTNSNIVNTVLGTGVIVFNTSGNNERLRVTNTGEIGIGTTTPTSRLQVKGSGTTDATTAFRVENANASGSMVVLDNGNVGIGTTSPSQKLHVVGSAKLTNALYLGGNADVIDPSSNSGFMTIGSNQPIRFTNASSTEFIRITTAGNVGIGTTTPSYKLDVSGSGNFTDNLTVTGSSTSLVNVISPRLQSLTNVNTYVSLAGGGGSFIDFRANNSPIVRMSSNGMFVGGDTTPTAQLQVKGSGTTSATTAFRVENANTSGSLIVRDDGQIQVRSTTVNNPGYSFIDNTNTGLYMFGGTMGTVVDGQYSILYNTAGPQLYSNTTNSITSANLLMAKIGSNHRMSIWMNGNNDFQFEAWQSGVGFNNNIILQLNGGNVGIGTTTPSYKLDVLGSGNFTNNLTVTGSATISNILTLIPQDPLPTGSPTGSFAVSSSVPPKPYFYDGTSWNALY